MNNVRPAPANGNANSLYISRRKRRLIANYPVRVALNPFVADIGGLLPDVISGSVIVSVVLSLPTTGPMLLSALKKQDVNLAATFDDRFVKRAATG